MLTAAGKINVLVADQLSHSRLVLETILEGEPDFDVVGVVADKEALMRVAREQAPDVLLLNYDLPGNKELLVLKQVFSEVPVPVILLVKREQLTLELVKEATALGVYAIILKPGNKRYPDYRSVAGELVYKIRAVQDTVNWDVQQRLTYLQNEVETLATRVAPRPQPLVDTVVVVGGSTGGTQAIGEIVKCLTAELKATVLVAVHLPAGFTGKLVQRLQKHTRLTVKEGKTGLLLKPGKLIVAPGGRNMVIQPVVGSNANYKISFAEDVVPDFDRPSIDLLMQSVANSSIKNVLGVILTGMGRDGTIGATTIHKRGGTVIAQDKASSAIFGMAKSVIDNGLSHHVLPLSEIPHFINRYVASQSTVSLSGDIL